jgi:hypothetical protein
VLDPCASARSGIDVATENKRAEREKKRTVNKKKTSRKQNALGQAALQKETRET